MELPLISVLMPVYNAEKYLAEAIESILGQTFTRFEFIIIDDCSTDSSASIINSYNDPRIRYYKNDVNAGISQTLNRGIELSRADWIARMDADDISYPARLERQYEFALKQSQPGMVYSWVRVITAGKEFIGTETFKPEFYFFNLIFECWIYHPVVLYNRQAVLKAGGYRTPFSEDFELFWKLSRFSHMTCIPEVLLDYRLAEQSLHRVTHKHQYEEFQDQQVLRNIRFYLGESTPITAEELACLRHQFEKLPGYQVRRIVKSSLSLLDRIKEAVIGSSNINVNNHDVYGAWMNKRNFIINHMLSSCSLPKGFLFLLFNSSLRRAIGFLRMRIFNRRNQVGYKGPTQSA